MLLSKACVSVLILVGDSDGRISDEEEDAFRQKQFDTLAGATIIDREHESVIMAFLIQEHRTEVFLQQQARSVEAHLKTIRKVAHLVQRKESRDVFLKYCRQMYRLAESIAEASRSYWGLGAAMSEKELAMLLRLRRLLLPLS